MQTSMKRTARLRRTAATVRLRSVAAGDGRARVATGPNIAIIGVRKSRTYARPTPIVTESTAAKRCRMRVRVANSGRHVATVENPDATIGSPTDCSASLHTASLTLRRTNHPFIGCVRIGLPVSVETARFALLGVAHGTLVL